MSTVSAASKTADAKLSEITTEPLFTAGVSNSFNAAGLMYIPGFYTDQTLLRKI